MDRRKLLVGAGYGAFSTLALLIGLYLTFPAEAVGQRISHEVQQKSGGEITISFEEIEPYRLSGVSAENVKVRTQKDGQQPVDMSFDVVRARLRLLPLFLFQLSFDTALELGEGEIEARVTPRGEGDMFASVEVEALNLASPPIVPMLIGFPVTGTVTGSMSADLTQDQKGSGGGTLRITGASFGPATIQGFSVPAIELGDLELGLAIDAGRAKVTSFKQTGGEIAAKISGSATLKPLLSSSTLDACLELKPDPAFLEKNPKVKAAVQIAEIQLKKNPEGFLHVPFSGTLGKPRYRSGLCRSTPRE
jgi:type II secretion system protein N